MWFGQFQDKLESRKPEVQYFSLRLVSENGIGGSVSYICVRFATLVGLTDGSTLNRRVLMKKKP